MKKLAVIGHPVAHSLSPLIHNHWIAEFGFDAHYEAIDITPAHLKTELQSLVRDGYCGFNVTLPHKVSVMNLCDTVDDTAKRIGAVNMISVDGDGDLHGFNTDSFGFIENIKAQKPDFDFTKKRAVILGAGGATRAIIDGLIQQHTPYITILNRTRAKAEDLAQSYDIGVIDWDDRNAALEGAGLLINATSLGMAGQPDLDIDLEALSSNAIVADIVYKPLMTDLLKQAKARGGSVVTGLGMLLQQARPSFREWFGVMPELDEALINKIQNKACV